MRKNNISRISVLFCLLYFFQTRLHVAQVGPKLAIYAKAGFELWLLLLSTS